MKSIINDVMIIIITEDQLSHVSESPPITSPIAFSIDKFTTSLETWTCSSLSDICFGPSTSPILPQFKSSSTHCITIRTDVKCNEVPLPFPSSFKDVWDENHVRMPCSSQCLYPISKSEVKKKWILITEALSRPIRNSYELEEAILSYNSRFATRWKFKLLHSFFNEYLSDEETKHFFSSVLPKMISLALSLPHTVTHGIPLLQKQQEYSITMSQHQISCLLSNAFFCTFPRRNTTGPSTEYSKYPTINFNTLFCSSPESKKLNKLKCLIHYFQRVTAHTPAGNLTFSRKVAVDLPPWEQCLQPFSKLHVTSEGTIEDNGHGMLQVDFANKYIGGGVLGQGCVQEEIRFLICPEMIISRLFTEELDSNESLLMIGSEQFSRYKGYAATFEWAGDYIDQTISDNWDRKETRVIAIDALVFHSRPMQFRPGLMLRELNKGYAGFMSDGYSTPCKRLMAVATGNWGCGAFGGEPHLKALLQWMSCSVAGRDIVYFTFDKKELIEELKEFHDLIVSLTVGDVWKLLLSYHDDIIKKRLRQSLLDYFKEKLV